MFPGVSVAGAAQQHVIPKEPLNNSLIPSDFCIKRARRAFLLPIWNEFLHLSQAKEHSSCSLA